MSDLTQPQLLSHPSQCGELGVGHKEICWLPTQVSIGWTGEPSTFFRTSQVACGADHSLALVMHHGQLVPCTAGEHGAGQPARL